MVETHKEPFSSHFLLSDQEILALGVNPSSVELYRRKHYQAKFGIDTWYHNGLQEHTFKTYTIPLFFDEAKAIVDKCLGKVLTTEQLDLLQKVKIRLDSVIEEHFPNGFFIKLNTRSPKDVPYYSFHNTSVQQKIIEEINALDPSERDDNNESIAFIKAVNKSMKLFNSQEAIDILGRSSRIREDFLKILQFGKHLFDAKLVLREWDERVADNPQMEFRCFVHKNSLNAITQYFHCSYFPELVCLYFFSEIPSREFYANLLISRFARKKLWNDKFWTFFNL